MPALLVPKLPIYMTGNGFIDFLEIVWVLFSGVFGLGCIKSLIKNGWEETSVINKIALVSLIIYIIFIAIIE